MARKDIYTVIKTGREQSIDENFIELYAAAASASAAIAALQSGSGAAWESYAPSLAAGSGSLTAATATGAYIANGKTVHFRAQVAITTNGTAATSIVVGLPATAAATVMATPVSGYLLLGADNNITFGVIESGGTTAAVYDYIGAYPGANNMTITIAGTYEKV